MSLYCNYGGYTGSQFFVEQSGPGGRGVVDQGGEIIVDVALTYGAGGLGDSAYTLGQDVRTISTVDFSDSSVTQWHVQTTFNSNCQHIITSTGAGGYSIIP
jgi:hypothetical protein